MITLKTSSSPWLTHIRAETHTHVAMSSTTAAPAFVTPPPFGAVGNYEDIPDYAIGSVLTLKWQNAPLNSALYLVHDVDDETSVCEPLDRANTTCAFIIRQS